MLCPNAEGQVVPWADIIISINGRLVVRLNFSAEDGTSKNKASPRFAGERGVGLIDVKICSGARMLRSNRLIFSSWGIVPRTHGLRPSPQTWRRWKGVRR